MVTVSDYRDAEQVEVHLNLARARFEHHTFEFRRALEANPDVARSLRLPAGPVHEYDGKIAVGGLLYGVVSVGLRDGESGSFSGTSAGLPAGQSAARGSGFLHYSLEELRGWNVRFELRLESHAASIDWWGTRGEYVGSFVGGGLTRAVGISGGTGRWS
jgi:hypothetical protein